MSDCKIYVACLASYNNGRLHGEWIEVPDNLDELQEEIDKILRTSPYPNVQVDCVDCDGTGFRIRLQTVEDRCETCKGTGKVPSAEEWAIHDYEGFAGILGGEHPDLQYVVTLAEMIDEHGEEAIKAACDELGDDYAVEAYRGGTLHIQEYRSKEDAAWELLESMDALSGLSERMKYYFDAKAWLCDCEMNGDIHGVEGSNGSYYIIEAE